MLIAAEADAGRPATPAFLGLAGGGATG